MYSDLRNLCVGSNATVREAMARMDESRIGIVLVVDGLGKLIGTVTDGDMRRAMLADVNLDQPVAHLLERKKGSVFAKPITAPVGADPTTYLALFKQHSILHLPLLDSQDRVAGLVTLDQFLPENVAPIQAVIMAGGKGSRMRPLTEEVPKPMLPVGDQPLMEIIIRQLKDAGIQRVHVTTHYKVEKIVQHFGDGRDFGVDLNYVAEDRPLGTAGGLGLIEPPKDTLLVINGDILTQVDYKAMLAFHREHRADLTMAVRQYDVQVPFGVVECQGPSVVGLDEKPLLKFFVNGGIYLLEPIVYQYIPNGKPFDMTDLIQRLVKEGRPVVSFPVREYWLDIGGHAEYERAERDIRAGKVRL